MSFLSGLPEARRKRRYLMPVQVFVDDSGGKGQGRHFILAGLIARSEQWAMFSDDWQQCLDQKPRLRYFKMREAASCTGQFHGLSGPDRDARLRELAAVINCYAKIVTYSGIDLDAHAETWAIRMHRPFNEPYFFPFQNMITASCFELWDVGLRERFEIIFDEHAIFGPRVKLWYPLMRDIARVREPEAHTIMPIDPMFKSDDEFLPLQACDLFAWCFRKGSDVGWAGERPFEWLLEHLGAVTLSGYRQYYDRERLESVLELSAEEGRKILDGDNTYLEVFDKHRELFGRRQR